MHAVSISFHHCKPLHQQLKTVDFICNPPSCAHQMLLSSTKQQLTKLQHMQDIRGRPSHAVRQSIQSDRVSYPFVASGMPSLLLLLLLLLTSLPAGVGLPCSCSADLLPGPSGLRLPTSFAPCRTPLTGNGPGKTLASFTGSTCQPSTER